MAKAIAAEEPPPRGFERHAQTVVQGVILVLVVWVGFSMVDMRERVVRLEERVGDLKTQIASGSDRRYLSTDAARDLELRDQRMNAIERRVDAMERKFK
jgi:hypothetical protein